MQRKLAHHYHHLRQNCNKSSRDAGFLSHSIFWRCPFALEMDHLYSHAQAKINPRKYLPDRPHCTDRLKLTWEYARDKIEEFLHTHPLKEKSCLGCYFIFCNSLFSYLLPDTILLVNSNLLELQDIYTRAFLKATSKSQNLKAFSVIDLENDLYAFVEDRMPRESKCKHIAKNIHSLSTYQAKIWKFCSTHDIANLEASPIPYHD